MSSLYKSKTRLKTATEAQKISSALQREMNILHVALRENAKTLKKHKEKMKFVGKFGNIFEELYPDIYKKVVIEYKKRKENKI